MHRLFRGVHRECPLDDFRQIHFFHPQFFDGEIAEDPLCGGGELVARDGDAVSERVELLQVAVLHHLSDLTHLFFLELVAPEADDAAALRLHALDEFLEGAIEDFLPLIEDDHVFAEIGDIVHIVGGEQDGHLFPRLVGAEELPQVHLGDDVEADRGLIEEEDLGLVEERGDELTLHALPERELAHGGFQHVLDLQELRERGERLVPFRAGNLVQVAVQHERVRGGEIPDELRFLPHHEADLLLEGAPALVRGEAEHLAGTGRGREDAGEHLQGRRLAGAVGPQESYEAPLGDGEADAIHGVHLLPLAPEDALQSGEKAGLLLVVPEGALQASNSDGISHGRAL